MPVMQSPPGAYAIIDGRRFLYFAGTGYLGLQGRAEVIYAAGEAAERYGIGSATSRLQTGFGDTPPVLRVEELSAKLFGTDDAFYFATGYLGTTILATVFRQQYDAIFIDEFSHYSVFDAAKLADRPMIGFAHRDPDDLKAKLEEHLPEGERPLVLTDGVFAALGEIAPLVEYHNVLIDVPGAIVAIDDAHGIGVLGDHGRGTLEHVGLMNNGGGINSQIDPNEDGSPRFYLCGTCSKAIGGYGGIIPGSRQFVQHVKTESHLYSGISPPPVPTAASTAKALHILLAEPETRQKLHQNVAMLREGLRNMGFEITDSPVPIISLKVGDGLNMQQIQKELLLRGICITYFGNYAGLGPEGALRIAVFATHTKEMIQILLDALSRLV